METAPPIDMRPHAPPMNVREHRPVPAGATLGRTKVAYSTPHRLALKETRKFMWGVIAGGAICTAIVYVGWMIYLKEVRDNIPLKILCIPLAGPLVVAFGALFLYRHRIFDGRRQAIISRRMFWRPLIEPKDAFKHVQVTVLTTSAKRREMVEVRLERPAKTGAPEVIGCLRTSKKKSLALLWTADEISRLLDLPLKVTGDSVEGSPEVCR
ncbi:MAG TPA: hypothetical protein VGP99_02135, partial [Tepidisphaeraceae bacterium]|nr:hypothetical protein [Tepidisphaeraceae bacterium]